MTKINEQPVNNTVQTRYNPVKTQGLGIETTSPGVTFADLTYEQRQQYFRQVEQQWKTKWRTIPGQTTTFTRG